MGNRGRRAVKTLVMQRRRHEIGPNYGREDGERMDLRDSSDRTDET